MGAKSSKGSRSRSRRGSANSCALQKRAYSNCRYRNISSQRSLQSLIASVRTLESQYRVKINRKNYLTGAIKKLEIEIRRLRDSYEALKSVCMSADANTKKNKKEQLEMLSGRYLDRINLLEAQKMY